MLDWVKKGILLCDGLLMDLNMCHLDFPSSGSFTTTSVISHLLSPCRLNFPAPWSVTTAQHLVVGFLEIGWEFLYDIEDSEIGCSRFLNMRLYGVVNEGILNILIFVLESSLNRPRLMWRTLFFILCQIYVSSLSPIWKQTRDVSRNREKLQS